MAAISAVVTIEASSITTSWPGRSRYCSSPGCALPASMRSWAPRKRAMFAECAKPSFGEHLAGPLRGRQPQSGRVCGLAPEPGELGHGEGLADTGVADHRLDLPARGEQPGTAAPWLADSGLDARSRSAVSGSTLGPSRLRARPPRLLGAQMPARRIAIGIGWLVDRSSIGSAQLGGRRHQLGGASGARLRRRATGALSASSPRSASVWSADRPPRHRAAAG